MKRREGLDFVRAISAVGIVCFHFYCHCSSPARLFFTHANGSWGGTLNYVFFALSGLVLQMKYASQEKLGIQSFYYKRWKATMPAYLLAFSYPFLMNVLSHGKVFYLDIPKTRLLLTLVGMDGYVEWVKPTYYITGEWFLGAILIAYLLYPLFHRVFRKLGIVLMAIFFVLYQLVWHIPALCEMFGSLPIASHPVMCLFGFSIGMAMADLFRYFTNKLVIIVAAAIGLLMVFVPLDGPVTLLSMSTGETLSREILLACAILIVGYNAGELLCKAKSIRRIIRFSSGLAYPVFLLHHRIVFKVLEGFDPTDVVGALLALMLTLGLTFVFAKVFDIVMKSIFSGSVFQRLDQRFLEKRKVG